VAKDNSCHVRGQGGGKLDNSARNQTGMALTKVAIWRDKLIDENKAKVAATQRQLISERSEGGRSGTGGREKRDCRWKEWPIGRQTRDKR